MVTLEPFSVIDASPLPPEYDQEPTIFMLIGVGGVLGVEEHADTKNSTINTQNSFFIFLPDYFKI